MTGFAKTKERRKHAKYSDKLHKMYEISLVDTPTQNLVICNGGLTNGLTQERIFEVLEPYGQILTVILPPKTSWAFIKYDSEESAARAIESHTDILWPGGGPAYLGYADRLPDVALHNNFAIPPGLLVIDDFITDEEEENLVQCLKIDFLSSTLKHRLVKHFGFEFRYDDNRASSTPIEAIPAEFTFLWNRLLEKTGINFEPNQCTVNYYAPGDGIPPHVDTHSAFTEYIVSLSLLSNVVMDWRKDRKLVHVLLPRRSLCVMTEESRYGWTHGITPRKNDVIPASSQGLTLRARSTRISLTFRRTNVGDCLCNYPALCDTVIEKMRKHTKGASEEIAGKFELDSVHKVYDEIANHFSETRQKPWPKVVEFLNSFSAGSLLLDVGCGSGRYLGCRPDVILLGCDRSASLLSLCHSAGHPVFLCDSLQVAVKDESMDGCICIAVIHHFSTEERRRTALREIIRILRLKGRALIYVWAKDQAAETKSSYLKQKKKNKQEAEENEPSLASVSDVVLPVHTNRTNFQHADMFVPWQLKPEKGTDSGPTFLRYYHVFENFELKALVESFPNVRCLDYYYDEGNWCIMIEKKETLL